MVAHDSLTEPRYLALVVTMELFEVPAVLHDAVEVLLWLGGGGGGGGGEQGVC